MNGAIWVTQLKEQAQLLQEAARLGDAPDVKEPLSRLLEAAEQIGQSWSGSNIGYQSRVYYHDFAKPPTGAHFSREWGFQSTYSNGGTRGKWVEYDYDAVIDLIEARAGAPELTKVQKASQAALSAFGDGKSSLLSIFTAYLMSHDDSYIRGLQGDLEKSKLLTAAIGVKAQLPSGTIMSRDAVAMDQGLQAAPHQQVSARTLALKDPFRKCLAAAKVAERAAEHIGRFMPSQSGPPYYHVRLSTKSNSARDEVRLDLTEEAVESKFLSPRREGRPIIINGTTIPIDDLERIRINRTVKSSDELRPIVRAAQRRSSVVTFIPEDWYIADAGDEVTDEFITEPPGGVDAAALGVFGNSASAPLPTSAPYVNAQILASIKAKNGTCSLNVAKLVDLIEELNDNYVRTNTYAAHALLRAILDHVPPILNCADFKAVANNYSWGQTDKKYMKRLLDFKNQADDALHRQITSKADMLDFDDMPASVLVDRLLQECADKL